MHARSTMVRALTMVFAAILAPRIVAGGVAPAREAQPAADSTKARLHRLIDTPGMSGREILVRDLVRSQLPPWAKPDVDSVGNLVLSIGSGPAGTLVVAALDEDGYVVSAITDEGFVRVHRPTREPQHRLLDQFHVGQPIQILTRRNGAVAGVTATPSTHLRRFLQPDEVTRVKGLEDLWIDVGASSRTQVEQLGVRILDGVTLRERAQSLAGGREAGPAAQARAGALALVELVRAWAAPPKVAGPVTIAWMSQSLFGSRGLNRLMEAVHPQRIILCGLALPPRGKESDLRGAVGTLGGGALAPPDNAELAALARERGLTLQMVPTDRFQFRKPAGWDGPVVLASVPVLFAQTPVETVDVRDVLSLAQLVAGALGTTAPRPIDVQPDLPPTALAESSTGAGPLSTADAMKAMIEAYGVSGHEQGSRAAVLRLIPRVAPWAKPVVDERGDVVVSFGAGGDEMVFMAHTDELGYEITGIRDDGTATVRTRGGMYDSLYEAHPMVLHTAKGPIPAVLAPRSGYVAADTASPRLDDLSLYFGVSTAAEARALGISNGDAATVRKRFTPLAGARYTSRSMDDRAGCAALLMALAKIDPAKATSKVTFAWTVSEETGLVGANFIAATSKAKYAFAVDTFVSTDSPFDTKRLAVNRLGSGAVLRGMDNSTNTPLDIIDRLADLARRNAIPVTIGVTAGGTDASAFSRFGAVDVGLSWPGRYSHSPAEVTDRRDIDALASLVAAVVTQKW